MDVLPMYNVPIRENSIVNFKALVIVIVIVIFQGNNFAGGRLDHQRSNGLQKSQFFLIAK